MTVDFLKDSELFMIAEVFKHSDLNCSQKVDVCGILEEF